MSNLIRAASASLAGLAVLAMSGPLWAGPFGNTGYAPATASYNYGTTYAPSNAPSYGPSNAVSYGPSNGHIVSGPVVGVSSGQPGCASGSCGAPVATSHKPVGRVDCPSPYYHVFEGPPNLRWKKGCPRPVCDPCELPHFGYFQTCWSPWPYPPDWRHCPYPTASDMLPPPSVPPHTPKLNAPRPNDTDFVEPRKDTKEKETPKTPKRGKDKDPDDDGPDMTTPKKAPAEPEKLDPPRKDQKNDAKEDVQSQAGPRVRMVTTPN